MCYLNNENHTKILNDNFKLHEYNGVLVLNKSLPSPDKSSVWNHSRLISETSRAGNKLSARIDISLFCLALLS